MSHLSSIGFPIKSQKALTELAEQALAKGEAIPGGAGHYYRWQLDVGSELWVHVDDEGALVGIEPHFAGPARMDVYLVGRFPRSHAELDGAFAAEAGRETMGEAHAFLFDVPDFARHTELALPTTGTIQLAAFAHSLEAFPDPASFTAAQSGQELAFAPETLVPVSFFAREPEPAPEIPPELAELFGDLVSEPDVPAVPESAALLSGVVLETEMLLNPASTALFRYARLRTAGGEVDVVADPRLVKGEVVAGGVIYGDCWLSGRLVTP